MLALGPIRDGLAARAMLRRWRRSPGWALAAVLSLALAIGANTAIFSVADAVLLRPLRYPQSERLVSLGLAGPFAYPPGPSLANLNAWRADRRVFSAVAGYQWQIEQPLMATRGALRLAHGVQVTPGLLSLLGAEPQAGRGFFATDFTPGAARIMLIAPEVQRQIGRGAQIGEELNVGGASYHIIGILPPGFRMPNGERPDYVLPLPRPAVPANVGVGTAIARLAPGADLAQARAAMAVYAARRKLAARHLRVAVAPLHRSVTQRSRPVLLMLWGAVGLLFLIACANLASLFSAQASEQRREWALQAALGASGGRVAGAAFGECLAIGLAASGLGLAVGWAGVRAIWAWAPPSLRQLAGASGIGLVGGAWVYAIGLGLLASLLFGMAPVLAARDADPARELQSGDGHVTGDRRGRRLRRALVLAEFALALPLAVAGVLLFQGLVQLRSVPPGFNPRHLLGLQVYLPPAAYPPKKAAAYARAALQKLGALPGVESAALIKPLPFSGMGLGLQITWYGGKARKPGAAAPPTKMLSVAAIDAGRHAFRTLGVHLLRGRGFLPGDARSHAAIVDERLAHIYWRGKNPIGAKLAMFHIVGVVQHVELTRVGEKPQLELFLPAATRYFNFPILGFVLRTRLPAAALKLAAVRALLAINPTVPPQAVHSLRHQMYASLAGPRFRTFLLALFAALAALLAALGVHGVLAFALARRRRELALRRALGASAGRVAGMMVREGMALAAGGLALGAFATIGFEQLIGHAIFGLPPLHGGVLAAAVAGLAALALGGCYASARRAAGEEPWAALRRE
ncbi:MAG: FtsX-like permease family protein [Terriglobales bacterium]